MDTYGSVRRTATYFNIVLPVVTIASALLVLTACGGAPSNPSAPSTSAPLSTAATAMLQVSAQALDTVVKLSWSPAPNAAGYLIYRDGSQIPLNPTAITDTTFEDIGLTNGRTYSYTVAAVDPTGNVILRSSEVRATPKSK